MFALDDLARLFNLTVREDAAGRRPDHHRRHADDRALDAAAARLGRRTDDLAARRAGARRAHLVRAGGLRQPRAGVDPRRRRSSCASRRGCSSSATSACRASRRASTSLGAHDARHARRRAADAAHRHAGRRPGSSSASTPTRSTSRDLRATRTTDTVPGVHLGDAPQTVLAIDLGPRFAVVPGLGSAGADAGIGAHLRSTCSAQTDAPRARQRRAPAPPSSRRRPRRRRCSICRRPAACAPSSSTPGHGGDDTGAKGAQGTLEKNVTLSVARRLKAALEARLGVARAADARRRSGRRPRSARGARQQQQGGSVHQPARQRVAAAGGRRRRGLLPEPRRLRRGGAARRRRATARRAAGARRRHRDIEIMPWEMAQARYIDQSAAFAQRDRRRAARARADEPARAAAGAVPRAGRRQHAGRARRARLPHQRRSRNSSSRATSTRTRSSQALVDGIVRYRAATAGARDDAAPLSRCRSRSSSSALAAAWVLFVGLPRWYAARQAPDAPRPAPRRRRRPAAAVRKITATLFYVSDDGMALTPVQREVPFGADRRRTGARHRRSAARGRRRRSSRRFRPTRSCATCSSPSAATRSSISPARSRARHPGGSLDEIFTVYTIVNALTVNLPADHARADPRSTARKSTRSQVTSTCGIRSRRAWTGLVHDTH